MRHMTEEIRPRIGITTTVPLEPFMASGAVPVDLNNLFITDAVPNILVEEAQVKGYPRNICTWIKGLYKASERVDAVVGVVRGDCSNTGSLLETLEREGKLVQPFSYPFDRNRKLLVDEIERLCVFLGTDMDKAGYTADEVERIRKLSREVDKRRWKHLSISAEDTHLALVSTSDMNSNPEGFGRYLEDILEKENHRGPDDGVRLGYIGVPPIIGDLFPRIEALGGRTVFFEVQRQFAMPSGSDDWIQRYLDYTYPYDIASRVDDIKEQIMKRKIEGIIHYVQSFCHRQIDDIIFRHELDTPILTMEGNLPGPMDERTQLRLETFLDVLEDGQ